MEFSRQEYWSGSPFPSPGDLPDPGIKPGSSALQADSLPSKQAGKPHSHLKYSHLDRRQTENLEPQHFRNPDGKTLEAPHTTDKRNFLIRFWSGSLEGSPSPTPHQWPLIPSPSKSFFFHYTLLMHMKRILRNNFCCSNILYLLFIERLCWMPH